MIDYSRFEQDVLDLVSRAHGLSVQEGRSEVDSIAMLAVLCDGRTEVVNRLLEWANVPRREVAQSCAADSGNVAAAASAAPDISSELEHALSVALKIAERCGRSVKVVDVFCALGIARCRARSVYERLGLCPKRLDELFERWQGEMELGDAAPTTIDYMAKLNSLIGLESVKNAVRMIADMVRFNAERQKKGLRAERLTDNFVFRGNPGTGKTEVARIIAGIYRQFGALKKGHLVEVDRSRLVAGYVGQSEEKTQAVIDSALDGVLFIDEAYALAQGGSSDYGAAVASVLVKRMEDDRDRLVVIAAGYADEMSKFIGMNPGFASRFTKTIDFPDYTGEELTRIFESMAKSEGYECSTKVVEMVRYMMDDVASWGGRVSGNARNVRNLLKAAKERMAKRVLAGGRLTKERLRRIEVEDVMPC